MGFVKRHKEPHLLVSYRTARHEKSPLFGNPSISEPITTQRHALNEAKCGFGIEEWARARKKLVFEWLRGRSTKTRSYVVSFL